MNNIAVISAFLVLSLSPTLAFAQPGAWPMFRHDPQRTARQTLPGNIDVPAVRWTIPTGGNHPPDRLILADVNLDGIVEAVLIRGGRIVARQPDGTFIWASDPISADWLLAVEDFDGNGRPEVFAASRNQGIFALEGATGSILWRSPQRNLYTRYSSDVIPVDINGDGRYELYVPEYGTGGNTATVYSFPDGFTGDLDSVDLNTADHGYWRGAWHDIGDVDGDGELEVVTTSHDRVIIYSLIDGEPVYTSVALDPFPHARAKVTVEDVDGDGLDEVVIASNNPSGSYPNSRRLLVFEIDAGDLVLRWSVNVDGAEGNHQFPRRPVADVIPGGSLEIVTSVFEPDIGWRILVFSGDAMVPEPVFEIPGMALLSIADLDGDGVAELIAQESDDVALSTFGTIRTFSFIATEPIEVVELWSIDRAMLPIEQSPWFLSDGPVGLSRSSLTTRPAVLSVDVDGDERSDHIVTIDFTGTRMAEREIRNPDIGALRSCDEVCSTVAIRLDGSIEILDTGLIPINDSVLPLGVADLQEMNYLAPPPVVGLTSVGPLTLITDSSEILRAYEVIEHAVVERWAVEDSIIDSLTSTMFFEVSSESAPLVVIGYTAPFGGIGIRLLNSTDSYVGETVSISDSREVSFVLPFTLMEGNDGYGDSIVSASLDRRDNTLTYQVFDVLSNEFSTLSPLTRDVTGSGDGIPAAFDVTGDGMSDLLTMRATEAMIVEFSSEEVIAENRLLPRSATWSDLSVIDADGDGNEDIFVAGTFGRALLNQELVSIWEHENEERVYYSLATSANTSSGETILAITRSREARFDVFSGVNGNFFYSIYPVVGELWPDENEALNAGFQPGSLTNAIATYGLEGTEEWAFIFGSTDGYLYNIAANDGVLNWSYNFRASVGEPIAADVNNDGLTEIVVPVGDGTIQVITRADFQAPVAVYDTDGTYIALGPEEDLDEIPVGSVVGANWPAVEGATSYEYQILLDGSVVVVGWTDAGENTSVVYEDLALQNNRRYVTTVRARSTEGVNERVSSEVSSDGFVVVDDEPPSVLVDITPEIIYPEQEGSEATAAIQIELRDSVALRRYEVEITDSDAVVIYRFGSFEIGGTNFSQEHVWEGHDNENALVDTGLYNAIVTATDAVGYQGVGSADFYVCTSTGNDDAGICEVQAEDGGPDSDIEGDSSVPREETWMAHGGACGCGVIGHSERVDVFFHGVVQLIEFLYL